MNDISELKKRADKLARQIGLIQTESRIGDVNTKIDELGNVIKELRYDNDRLARENAGKDTLALSLEQRQDDDELIRRMAGDDATKAAMLQRFLSASDGFTEQ